MFLSKHIMTERRTYKRIKNNLSQNHTTSPNIIIPCHSTLSHFLSILLCTHSTWDLATTASYSKLQIWPYLLVANKSELTKSLVKDIFESYKSNPTQINEVFRSDSSGRSLKVMPFLFLPVLCSSSSKWMQHFYVGSEWNPQKKALHQQCKAKHAAVDTCMLRSGWYKYTI